MEPLSLLKRVINSPSLFWLVLAIPAPAFLIEVYQNERYYAEIMYETGLLSTQLLIVALAITPVMQLCRKLPLILPFLRWVQKRRRAIGVASFAYAGFHTFYYVRHIGSLELVWLEVSEWELAVGWVAALAMLVLAITSNNFSVRKLGAKWKPLQRGAYFAAGFTLLHWYLIGQFEDQMFIWFVPLVLLQAFRLALHFAPRKVQ